MNKPNFYFIDEDSRRTISSSFWKMCLSVVTTLTASVSASQKTGVAFQKRMDDRIVEPYFLYTVEGVGTRDRCRLS
jgi:hypothetical protein